MHTFFIVHVRQVSLSQFVRIVTVLTDFTPADHQKRSNPIVDRQPVVWQTDGLNFRCELHVSVESKQGDVVQLVRIVVCVFRMHNYRFHIINGLDILDCRERMKAERHFDFVLYERCQAVSGCQNISAGEEIEFASFWLFGLLYDDCHIEFNLIVINIDLYLLLISEPPQNILYLDDVTRAAAQRCTFGFDSLPPTIRVTVISLPQAVHNSRESDGRGRWGKITY